MGKGGRGVGREGMRSIEGMSLEPSLQFPHNFPFVEIAVPANQQSIT